jgi:hypothetical protein
MARRTPARQLPVRRCRHPLARPRTLRARRAHARRLRPTRRKQHLRRPLTVRRVARLTPSRSKRPVLHRTLSHHMARQARTLGPSSGRHHRCSASRPVARMARKAVITAHRLLVRRAVRRHHVMARQAQRRPLGHQRIPVPARVRRMTLVTPLHHQPRSMRHPAAPQRPMARGTHTPLRKRHHLRRLPITPHRRPAFCRRAPRHLPCRHIPRAAAPQTRPQHQPRRHQRTHRHHTNAHRQPGPFAQLRRRISQCLHATLHNSAPHHHPPVTTIRPR